MTDIKPETQRNPVETLSDRDLLEEIAGGLRHIQGLLESLGIKNKLSYMDLAGIARKVRKGT